MPYKRPSHENTESMSNNLLIDQDIPTLIDYPSFIPSQVATPSRQHQFEEPSSPPSIIHLSNLVSPIRDTYFLTSPSHDISLFSYLQSPQLGILSPSFQKETLIRQENYRRTVEMIPPFADTIPIALPVLPAVPALPEPSEDPNPVQAKTFQISPSNVFDAIPFIDSCEKEKKRKEKWTTTKIVSIYGLLFVRKNGRNEYRWYHFSKNTKFETRKRSMEWEDARSMVLWEAGSWTDLGAKALGYSG